MNDVYRQFLSSLTDEQIKQDRANQERQTQILVEFAKNLFQVKKTWQS